MVKPCGLCASSKRSRTSLGASGRRELEMISGIAQALRHVVVVQSREASRMPVTTRRLVFFVGSISP